MITLGINWRWHDATAALVDNDGSLIHAVEEERLIRKKHAWGRTPAHAAAECLAAAGFAAEDVDAIAIGWDLRAMPRRERHIPSSFGTAELIHDALGWSAERLPEIEFVPHHLSHATSAFYASAFKHAGVVVADGHGEDEALSLFEFRDGAAPKRLASWPRPFSLGYMYDAATRSVGFAPLEDGKTMGLSAYGDKTSVEPLFRLGSDGLPEPLLSLQADVTYGEAVKSWRSYIEDHFGRITTSLDELHRDQHAVQIAATAQRTVELIFHALVEAVRAATGVLETCLAGGVALNCVANGLLDGPVFVPPFPHDVGVAIGAAWTVSPPRSHGCVSPYTGHVISEREAVEALRVSGLSWMFPDTADIWDRLAAGQVGAVAAGAAEIGPRALGNRSILAVPRPVQVRDVVNRLKGREPWRPFGAVASQADGPSLWSGSSELSRYMIGSALVTEKARCECPAAVHVDGSSRAQELDLDQIHDPGPTVLGEILRCANAAGVPALLNTSFNGRNQPMVHNATDAVASFRSLDLDFMVLGNVMVEKPAR